MSDNKDLCPINASGDHRYFVFKTSEVFELLDMSHISELESALMPKLPSQLYVKKEYAILGCNCGSVIKTEVKNKQ